VLASLYRIQGKYDRRMLVNAKCAPHYIKTVLESACGLREGPEGSPAERDPRAQASGGGAPRALENAAQTDPIPTDARLRQGYGGQAESAPGLSRIRTYSGGAGGCPAGTHYMGIRPNGDVTPCPYLPVFAGTLRSSSLADLWTSSELFVGIRRRTSLGGRCGECEMNGHCGGCRARAYGMTGDLMAEDPLCTHTPGTFVGSPLLALIGGSGRLHAAGASAFAEAPADRRSSSGGWSASLAEASAEAGGAKPPGLIIEYGPESPATIPWDDAAAARMKKIPAFVRGMVVKAVEDSCRRNGIGRVTAEELEKIRARMPTPKIFG
jgi:radical SAM protein with 4Fe4S-binding SPASM domain